MENKSIQVMNLKPEELIAAIASIECVLDKCGEALLADDPYKHGVMTATAFKLKRLYESAQETFITRS